MPRFGIKLQIALLALGLLSVPFLGLRYWDDIQHTALAAQARIQEVEARAIATGLLASQPNIRTLLAADEASNLAKYALAAPSVFQAIELDGVLDDWSGQQRPRHPQTDYLIWQADPTTPTDLAFDLKLAQNDDYLFVALRVKDAQLSYRDPDYLRLDFNDHIQLTYLDDQSRLRRVLIPAERDGPLASYYTDANWRYGKNLVDAKSGRSTPSHLTGMQGYWRKTAEGYLVEMRLPKSQLDPLSPKIHVAVVDVDGRAGFEARAIKASLPKALQDQLNPVGIHAQEFQRVIDNLKNTYARLAVYDRSGREWAYAEREPRPPEQNTGFESQCVRDALNGNIHALSPANLRNASLKRLTVCYPIAKQNEVLGVVVIDESPSHVLQQEEQRMREIALGLGSVIAAVLTLLLIYAFSLARRVTRLSDEARRTIDPNGRIERTQLQASQRFPDELGDLSRTISALLEKQQSYVRFLERVPLTLRHEIANPLNKLRTSLELLLDDKPALAEDAYIGKINKGIDQISQITQQLTEAASLESAIQNEELHRLDLRAFLNDYLSTWADKIQLDLGDGAAPAHILGDSVRLEQLFDKLLDNACSFKSEDGAVRVSLAQNSSVISVFIENDGPLLATDNPWELFAPMTSTRSSGAAIHLGLGLHVAKLICDHHGATLNAHNLESKRGVVFSVTFSLQ